MKLSQKRIGIVGGAGPMASCLLNEYVIKICQTQYGCKQDQDFPIIVNYSFPFSPMLNVSDSTENYNKIANELNNCFEVLGGVRSSVHRHCM